MFAGRATKRDIVLALPTRRFQITSPAPQTTRLVRVFCRPEFWVLGFCLRPAHPDNKRMLKTAHFLTNNPDPDTQTQSAQQNTLQSLISIGSLERARGSCPYDQKCENVPARVLTRPRPQTQNNQTQHPDTQQKPARTQQRPKTDNPDNQTLR